MGKRRQMDISAYLVIGPENTKGRPVESIVKSALMGGFTCLQLRAKHANARETVELSRNIAAIIREFSSENKIRFLLNDRLDILLAAREMGIKIDGIHVGQEDIPVAICRKYLGEDAIIGLTAPKIGLIEFLSESEISYADYLGIGPIRETKTKANCQKDANGRTITKSLQEIEELHRRSPVPFVVGGGVKYEDLQGLKAAGADGFFVVSEIAEAENPEEQARRMVALWKRRN